MQFWSACLPNVSLRASTPTIYLTTLLFLVHFPPDILNRLNPNPQSKPGPDDPWVDPDPQVQLEHARHLAKYVFARQYGLPSPFVAEKAPLFANQLPDYSEREHQIQVYLGALFLGHGSRRLMGHTGSGSSQDSEEGETRFGVP